MDFLLRFGPIYAIWWTIFNVKNFYPQKKYLGKSSETSKKIILSEIEKKNPHPAMDGAVRERFITVISEFLKKNKKPIITE